MPLSLYSNKINPNLLTRPARIIPFSRFYIPNSAAFPLHLAHTLSSQSQKDLSVSHCPTLGFLQPPSFPCPQRKKTKTKKCRWCTDPLGSFSDLKTKSTLPWNFPPEGSSNHNTAL